MDRLVGHFGQTMARSTEKHSITKSIHDSNDVIFVNLLLIETISCSNAF